MPFHAGQIGLRHLIRRNADGWVHPPRDQRLRHPGRADDVHAPSHAGKSMAAARTNPSNPALAMLMAQLPFAGSWLKHAAGEREGAMVGHERFADADQIGLPISLFFRPMK